MNYQDSVLKTNPFIYLPLDDAAPSSAARQIGSSPVTATYDVNARKSHHEMIGSAGVNRHGSFTGPDDTTNAVANTGGFTMPTSFTVAWWEKVDRRSAFPNGQMQFFDVGTSTRLLWVFTPFTNGNAYFYVPPGLTTMSTFPFTWYGRWMLWVVTWTAAGWTIMRNNSLITSGTSGSITALTSTVLSLYATASNQLQHVTVWDRVLTTRERGNLWRARGL